MTYCSIYVGDLDDPDFHWEGGDWNGNIPTAVTPGFPPTSESYNGDFFKWVHDRPDIVWKQTDYGGYVAKVTKTQILEFIDFCYGPDPNYRAPRKIRRHKKNLNTVYDPKEMRDYVMMLSDANEYGLVAEEW